MNSEALKAKTLHEAQIRTFDTGATRSGGTKPEYAGYLHPSVIKAYGAYMLKNQTQADGSQRESRNYQKGITQESYMQSMFRHFVDVWSDYEARNEAHNKGFDVVATKEQRIEALTALFFNVHGMLMEVIRETP
jgi:hypothetical protein